MTPNYHSHLKLSIGLAGLALAAAVFTPTAKANVYATNIKFNGARNSVPVPQNSPVTISYVLNEPATLGATVKILSGPSTVKTLVIAAGNPGTLKGTNLVVWNGQDETGTAAPAGSYRVSITAVAQGYTGWAELTAMDTNTAVWSGCGVAVNCNTNSPYFGRIYVGNAHDGTDLSIDGYRTGISMRNADASPADEGGFTTGGFSWGDNYLGPWKVAVSADDSVYISDISGASVVMRWNASLATNSELNVLRPSNWTNSSPLTGLALTGSGTNAFLWSTDNSDSGLGVVRWPLGPDGACAGNDPGSTVIGLGLETNLTLAPAAVVVDAQGNVYTCQRPPNRIDPAPRVFCFPATTSPTNSTAKWAIGGGSDQYCGAAGLAIDPSGNYVAVAFLGYDEAGLFYNGCTRVFYATNGALAADVDLAPELGGFGPSDTDCAWDRAGNLYFIDNSTGYWHAFSPPGTNQFTTVSAQSLQVMGLQITSMTILGGAVHINFSSRVGDLPSSFKLLGAAGATGSYNEVTTAQFAQTAPGAFTATAPTNAASQFYRIQQN